MAATKNSKGPYTVRLTGYKFGGSPSDKCPTITGARDWADAFGDDARGAVIFDKQGRYIADHIIGG